jgi:hypothetical protein
MPENDETLCTTLCPPPTQVLVVHHSLSTTNTSVKVGVAENWNIFYIFCIIIIIISFMQGVHTYIPETNHFSRVYSVAGMLRVLLMVHIMLSPIVNFSVLLH